MNTLTINRYILDLFHAYNSKKSKDRSLNLRITIGKMRNLVYRPLFLFLLCIGLVFVLFFFLLVSQIFSWIFALIAVVLIILVLFVFSPRITLVLKHDNSGKELFDFKKQITVSTPTSKIDFFVLHDNQKFSTENEVLKKEKTFSSPIVFLSLDKDSIYDKALFFFFDEQETDAVYMARFILKDSYEMSQSWENEILTLSFFENSQVILTIKCSPQKGRERLRLNEMVLKIRNFLGGSI